MNKYLYLVVVTVWVGKVERCSKTMSGWGLRPGLILEKWSRNFAKAGRPDESDAEGEVISPFFTPSHRRHVERVSREVESAVLRRLEAGAQETLFQQIPAYPQFAQLGCYYRK
jgi:hypothetical protein